MSMDNVHDTLLEHNQEMTSPRIAELTGLTQGSVNSALERLLKRGMVELRQEENRTWGTPYKFWKGIPLDEE